jgi:hypothetical protein
MRIFKIETEDTCKVALVWNKAKWIQKEGDNSPAVIRAARQGGLPQSVYLSFFNGRLVSISENSRPWVDWGEK